MNTAILITGSNLGERSKNLKIAADNIGKHIGTIIEKSSIYETEAWGKVDEPSFYNQVLIVQTLLSPENLMEKILSIEKEMGRVRTIKNAARIIDVDILFYNDVTIKKNNLEIPHKEITHRRFVLMPLAEVCPAYIHPVFQLPISILLEQCTDGLEAVRLPFK